MPRLPTVPAGGSLLRQGVPTKVRATTKRSRLWLLHFSTKRSHLHYQPRERAGHPNVAQVGWVDTVHVTEKRRGKHRLREQGGRGWWRDDEHGIGEWGVFRMPVWWRRRGHKTGPVEGYGRGRGAERTCLPKFFSRVSCIAIRMRRTCLRTCQA